MRAQVARSARGLGLVAGGVALAVVALTAAPAMGDVIGTPGRDSIRGGLGPNWIEGRAGRDRIWGDWGNDRLRGQQGRDLIRPGRGADESHGGGDRDRFLLRDDGASDRVRCGTGSDIAMYAGQPDAADALTSCERVWTGVRTPGCVTSNEWARARPGMRKARVHRILETGGELSIQRTPTDFGRSYRQCRPDPGFDACDADLDFRVDSAGVPRLVGKFWGSFCWGTWTG